MSQEQRVYLSMKIKGIKQRSNAQCRETLCTASSTLRGAWSSAAPLVGPSTLSAVASDGDTNTVGDFGENGSETTLPSGDGSCWENTGVFPEVSGSFDGLTLPAPLSTESLCPCWGLPRPQRRAFGGSGAWPCRPVPAAGTTGRW